MARCVIITLIALCIATSALARNRNRNRSNRRPTNERVPEVRLGNKEYDFFVFETQWPTWTNRVPCVNDFTIHGLWPSRSTATHPQSDHPRNCLGDGGEDICKHPSPCDGDDADVLLTQLDALHQQQMVCRWPTNKGTTNTYKASFWDHEWDEHGECAVAGDPRVGENPYANMKDYFTGVLETLASEQLSERLASNGVVPDDTKKYHIQDMYEAAGEDFEDRSLFFLCKRQGDLNVLSGATFCYDTTIQKRVVCPKGAIPRNQCGSLVVFPVLPEAEWTGDVDFENNRNFKPAANQSNDAPTGGNEL